MSKPNPASTAARTFDFGDVADQPQAYHTQPKTNGKLPAPLKTFSEAEWLECYLNWFWHFRTMQPSSKSEVFWRENKQLNDWASSMTDATLVPYWIGFFGAKTLPHYRRRIKNLKLENNIS
jgi:hypothetical protein